MSPRRAVRVLRVLGLALAALSATPALAAAPTGLALTARLQGTFDARGTVISAVNVPGEHRGQRVLRSWTFVPQCPQGACATVQLIRQRGTSGEDRLLLRRQRPGYYKASGAFTVPVQCAGRLYSRGERAPFTITLTITSAVVSGMTTQATGFTATYRNSSRTSLTRCYTAPSYDSARYVGAPAPPVASGATRRDRSTRLSTGS